jgi:hypothetical protein
MTKPWKQEIFRVGDKAHRAAVREHRLKAEKTALEAILPELQKLAPAVPFELTAPLHRNYWAITAPHEVELGFVYTNSDWQENVCQGLRLRCTGAPHLGKIRSIGRNYTYDFAKGSCPSLDKVAKAVRGYVGKCDDYGKAAAVEQQAKKEVAGAVTAALKAGGYELRRREYQRNEIIVAEDGEDIITVTPSTTAMVSTTSIPIKMNGDNALLVMEAVKALRKAMEM